MANEIMVKQHGFSLTNQEFETMQRMAKAMVASGYFSDARDVAQAIVKIQAGSEIGIPPFAAMSNIHVIKGKPVLGANLIATLIKNDARYDYRVARLDDDGCTIVFYEHGQEVGESSFTAADAKTAGLNGDNWRKFARNMYFARAISNGAKWYTPGIFGGSSVYTPDELGAEEDGDGNIVTVTAPKNVDPGTGEIIEGEIEDVPDTLEFEDLTPASAEPPQDKRGASSPAEQAKRANKRPRAEPVTNGNGGAEYIGATELKRLHALGTETYGPDWDEKRPQLVKAVTKGRTESSKELTTDEAQRLEAGMRDKLEA